MAISRRLRRSHYRLLGLVGHGQFGRVYCAIHRQTGDLVALKDLNRDRFSTHKFLRELRFLLSLEHPNIATCQALEHSATGRQLVLDYCEGGTLRALIEHEVPLSLAEVLGFVSDILRALDQAHRQGIVHCDIKPENILLSIVPGGWQVKISDFGIARLSLEASEAELGNTGSPAYMAPERFYNQHPAASDLYAVGVILYELLAGQRPFSGTPTELMVAHLNQRAILPERLPVPLNEILRKALQKLLAKRYKTAAEMLAAVETVAHQLSQEQLASSVRQPLEPPMSAPALAFVTLPYPVEVVGWVNVPLTRTHQTAQGQEVTQGTLLVTGCQRQVWVYHWTGQGQERIGQPQGLTLPWPIRQFQAVPYGGCLFTDYSIHMLSMKQGVVAIARFDHPVKAALTPDGRWFAACNIESLPSERQLLLRRLTGPDHRLESLPLTRVSMPVAEGQVVALSALDTRHFLVAIAQAATTTFQCFTRRGTAVGTLSLSTALQALVPAAKPYRFLALEQHFPNVVLVIDFKPFRVSRYRLDIQPHWLIDTGAGYAAISLDGKLRLISEEGQVIGQIDRLPRPADVLPLSATQLLWAVSEGAYSRIYTVDLKTLGLDIIF
ncbi:MAG: serine/threonine protein kinase [Cyanobacteria bacterium Co-bin8]|nr:serine/threonine protein kinase [Cyanobacteria bacterium Co-bin8]